MPIVETSAPVLAKAAKVRCARKDIAGTAVWHYPTAQPKANLLLVHGFRGNHFGLSAIAGALIDYNVLIPDLPGYGKSPALVGEHSLDNYGKWLVALIGELPGEWIVLGHSFGSLVVSNALSHGLRPSAIVLQNPITTRASEQIDPANRLARFFYAACGKMGAVGSALLRSSVVVRVMSIAMATSKSPSLRSWIHAQHHQHFSCYVHDRVAMEGFAAASAGNVLDYADHFQAPTLLIAGEKDSIAPLQRQVLAQLKIPGSALEVIPKVGHLTHYESAATVAKLIDEFVSKQ
jgi:pimeloyl-ACP methyl ester carboxylesterase